ncbi:MAG: DUF1499 domain-containing protein [Pelovirga sp.]
MASFKSLPLLLSLSLCLISCSGTRPTDLGITANKLSPCPASPNCVSSDSNSSRSNIAAFELKQSAQQSWQAVGAQVESLPRTQIVSINDNYLHAECRSALFGFVDDLELHLRPEQGIIAVRSAARKGYYDFGVNRRRVETLRSALREDGAVH